jgi:hypothetical protein
MPQKDTPAIEGYPVGTAISELKHKPDGKVSRYQCELVAGGTRFAMVLFRVTNPGAFDTPVAIEPGTRSFGFFWAARPINAYRFVAADGTVVAHRFDAMADVRIKPDAIEYRDLALDWWALPDGTLLEEDRDEFEGLVAAGTFDRSEVAMVQKATQLVHSRYRHIIDELEELQRRYAGDRR